ncbi:MAG: MMPL family transporter [Solirubrobacteraceae bacterium]|nr:MMPL family transporter [Solirubrobacteraceae bacterium]
MPAQTDPTHTPEPPNPKGSSGASLRDASVPARGFARVVGPRARWIVIALWLVAAVVTIGLNLPGKLGEVETNEARNYLPADAESTEAYEAVSRIIKTENVPLVAVVRREGGLSKQDLADIRSQLASFNRTGADQPIEVTDPDTKEERKVTLADVERSPKGDWLTLGDVSKDGTTALILGAVKVTEDSERLLDGIDALRSGLLPLREEGRVMKVTGGAGFSYDAIKVFGNLNASLVLGALALVFVLLLVIYRSPFLLWFPLLAVVFAEVTSRGVAYLTTDLGVTVTGQSSSIMSVLVLGAGTDYALLVTSRYREELRHHENRHDALRLAMVSAGPAVLASGLTVVAGLLTLMVASVEGTAGLGPLGAIGVAVAMLSMLTLLPAVFAVLPRGVFWPVTPKAGSEGADATHGFWRRTGERISRHPRRTWIVTGLLLLVCAGGLTQFNPNLSQNDTFIGDVESVEGGDLLAKSFPGGTSAPAQVVVRDPAKVQSVVTALSASKEIGKAVPIAEGEDGAVIDATLNEDPFSIEGQDAIPAVRETAKKAGGQDVLVGGDTAINYDLAKANDRDLKLIIPIVLFVVLLILIALLRALVLPLILIGTVVVSFAAALGLSSLLWQEVFGFAGADRSIILFAFVFLVALGIDYNIFLASRIREEALQHGTTEGILRGIGATGGVITAAGIVLAGTFLVLASTPVVFLVETGSAIALGVLLDTFIVRSILAPALALDVGRKIWWPWQAHIPQDGAADDGAGATKTL